MDVCLSACLPACLSVCMHACTHACMYACVVNLPQSSTNTGFAQGEVNPLTPKHLLLVEHPHCQTWHLRHSVNVGMSPPAMRGVGGQQCPCCAAECATHGEFMMIAWDFSIHQLKISDKMR